MARRPQENMMQAYIKRSPPKRNKYMYGLSKSEFFQQKGLGQILVYDVSQSTRQNHGTRKR